MPGFTFPLAEDNQLILVLNCLEIPRIILHVVRSIIKQIKERMHMHFLVIAFT